MPSFVRQKAAVRSPFPFPLLRQLNAGALTWMCPVGRCPCEPPSSATSLSRASIPFVSGQGCPSRQVSSISRVAIPASRIRGPSAHQIGPSPSQTRVGVHSNTSPSGMTVAAAKSSSIVNSCYSQPMPSRSRSRCTPYPGSPLSTGAAPAARASAQFRNTPLDAIAGRCDCLDVLGGGLLLRWQ